MESELSLANCIPRYVSQHTDACFRIAGHTCLGEPPHTVPPPPFSLETLLSFQTSLSHVSAHPGKTHLGSVIRIIVTLHVFLFHQKKSPVFGSLPLKN